MKHVVYAFSATVALTLMTVSASLAQAIPHSDRLTQSKLQQFSRDLTPSSSQDFFNAGQIRLEQEIRLLAHPQSPREEHLLTVREGAQVQPADQLEPPAPSPRN